MSKDDTEIVVSLSMYVLWFYWKVLISWLLLVKILHSSIQFLVWGVVSFAHDGYAVFISSKFSASSEDSTWSRDTMVKYLMVCNTKYIHHCCRNIYLSFLLLQKFIYKISASVALVSCSMVIKLYDSIHFSDSKRFCSNISQGWLV